jgi:Ca2+-binding RTX toxin-like protein
MSGGAGNDTYFVDNAGDAVIESPNQGSDVVFASVNYALTPDVETLVLQAAPTCRASATARRTRSSAIAATTSSTGTRAPM